MSQENAGTEVLQLVRFPDPSTSTKTDLQWKYIYDTVIQKLVNLARTAQTPPEGFWTEFYAHFDRWKDYAMRTRDDAALQSRLCAQWQKLKAMTADAEFEQIFRLYARVMGPTRTVPVPIVFDDQIRKDTTRNDEGALATLHVEILPHNETHTASVIRLRPGEELKYTATSDFRESISTAFEVAKACAIAAHPERAGELERTDGEWRVELEPQAVRAELETISGTSAGGAAVRAWYFALLNKVPDAGVIVLSDVDAAGNLGRVGGIAGKVKRILAASRKRASIHRIDTIVVADLDNFDDVMEALGVQNADQEFEPTGRYVGRDMIVQPLAGEAPEGLRRALGWRSATGKRSARWIISRRLRKSSTSPRGVGATGRKCGPARSLSSRSC